MDAGRQIGFRGGRLDAFVHSGDSEPKKAVRRSWRTNSGWAAATLISAVGFIVIANASAGVVDGSVSSTALSGAARPTTVTTVPDLAIQPRPNNLNLGSVLKAGDDSGDSIETFISFSNAVAALKSNVNKSALASCRVDSARALVVEVHLQTTSGSSPAVQVSESFPLPATDPGSPYVVMGYSAGPRCEPPSNGIPGVKFTVGHRQWADFSMWVVLPNTITPNGRASAKVLGNWLIEAPTVTLEGDGVFAYDIWGVRLVTCGDGFAEDDTNYLVPAGNPPSSIDSAAGNESCTPKYYS